MALPQGGPINPAWSWSVQLSQPGAPTTAPPAPPTPPAPPRDDYGGETVTLVPGRLRGYRSWRIIWPQPVAAPGISQLSGRFEPYLYPPNVTLAGVTATTGWRPSDQPEAECQRLLLVQQAKYNLKEGQDPEHPEGAPVPAKGCSCGYYALHSPSDYQVYFTAPCVCPRCVQDASAVMGVVEGWGRVEIGPLGWRARQARIVALHIPVPRPAERTEVIPQPVQPIWQFLRKPAICRFRLRDPGRQGAVRAGRGGLPRAVACPGLQVPGAHLP